MTQPVAERVARWAARRADDAPDGEAEVAGLVALRFGIAALAAVALGQLTCGLTDLLAFPLGVLGVYAASVVMNRPDATPHDRHLAVGGGIASGIALGVLLLLFGVFGSVTALALVGLLD